jgi:hypothetical protein
MNTDKNINKIEIKAKLSMLWIFLVVNYLYCDFITLMDPETSRQLATGTVGGMQITQGFLLGSSILMEIPMVMIVFSRILKYKINRLANIIASIIMIVVQILSLFVDAPTSYYIFFSIIEIVCALIIFWYAWRWINKIENN